MRKRRGGRGGQMWLQLRRDASVWRCKTTLNVEKNRTSDRQTDRQADRQLGSFQTRGTSGKSESVLVSPAELILFVPAQDEQLLRAFVFSFLKTPPQTSDLKSDVSEHIGDAR